MSGLVIFVGRIALRRLGVLGGGMLGCALVAVACVVATPLLQDRLAGRGAAAERHLVVQNGHSAMYFMPTRYLQEITEIEGVAHAYTVSGAIGMRAGNGNALFPVVGVELEAYAAANGIVLRTEEGRLNAKDWPALTSGEFDAEPGTSLRVTLLQATREVTRRVGIAGAVADDGTAPCTACLIIDRALFESTLEGYDDVSASIHVRVAPGHSASDVSSRIDRHFEHARVPTRTAQVGALGTLAEDSLMTSPAFFAFLALVFGAAVVLLPATALALAAVESADAIGAAYAMGLGAGALLRVWGAVQLLNTAAGTLLGGAMVGLLWAYRVDGWIPLPPSQAVGTLLVAVLATSTSITFPGLLVALRACGSTRNLASGRAGARA